MTEICELKGAMLQYIHEYFMFLWLNSPVGATAFSFLGFHDQTNLDTLHSVGLLWTSDQSVAETSMLQPTTLTRDKHSCPLWDSNP
jgi:hypothetical protein